MNNIAVPSSSGTTRISGSKKDSGSGSNLKDKDRDLAKAINAEFSDDDDEDKNAEENWDDDEKVAMTEEDEDDADGEEKKPKEEKRKKEKSERQTTQNEDDDGEAERDGEGEKEDAGIKEEEDEGKREGEEDEAEEDEEERAGNEKEKSQESDGIPSKRDSKQFIKLHCPHCAHRSSRFKEYSVHLFSGRHNTAMRRIAARHKATLARMRVVQRQEQRKLEARDASRGTLPSRTMFCQICKLNYRSIKAVHHLSDSHRQMKRFLTPFCRVCRMQFRSPMLFETHIASLDHLKRKNMLDDRVNGAGSGEGEGGDSSAQEEDDKEVDLNNFMTLDSVGDVDGKFFDAYLAEEGDETVEKKKKDKSESETTPDSERKAKTKQMIKVGSEYIKKVEVQFCDLCKVYLPRNENTERALALHCSTRSHLKRYVRDNDDKALRRQAERIHLQTSSSTNTSSTNSTNPTETAKTISENSQEPLVSANSALNDAEQVDETVSVKEEQPNDSIAETNEELKPADGEEEMWDDVGKDIGDILAEADNEPEHAKLSDDEDSRYDRFRNSDKKKKAIKEN